MALGCAVEVVQSSLRNPEVFGEPSPYLIDRLEVAIVPCLREPDPNRLGSNATELGASIRVSPEHAQEGLDVQALHLNRVARVRDHPASALVLQKVLSEQVAQIGHLLVGREACLDFLEEG